MRITFTGTAGAGGVPRYGCTCAACELARYQPEKIRRPCSVLIETDKTRILLDAGLMDIHDTFPAGTLDAIVLTHYHPDHVQGLFHLRWGVGQSIPVYAPPDKEGCADLFKNPGILDFRVVRKFDPLRIGNLTLTPLPLIHSKICYGYAIADSDNAHFAYLTDTVGLPPKTLQFLNSWPTHAMALDCSHIPQSSAPANHNDLLLALKCIKDIEPKQAWLTHISHNVDNWLIHNTVNLPDNVSWARDKLSFDLRNPGAAPCLASIAGTRQ